MSQVWSRMLKQVSVLGLAGILAFTGHGIKSVSAASDDSKSIVDVAFGVYHSVAAAKDGTVWSWGNNAFGQLGIGKGTAASQAPVKVTGIDHVIAVDAGSYYTAALREDGTVWVWGSNLEGELGDGTYSALGPPDNTGGKRIADDRNAYKPQVVPQLTGIVGIRAMSRGTVAWDQAGSLWSWGDSLMGNPYAGMSEEHEKKKLTPSRNESFSNVKSVAGADYVLSVLSGDGTIEMQGSNGFGQLGNGERSDSFGTAHVEGLTNVLRVETTGRTTIAYLNDGKVLEWGQALLESKGLNPTDPATIKQIPVNLKPTATKELQGFSDIQSTIFRFVEPSFLALKPDGTVWTHGDNAQGQLGLSGIKERYSWGKVDGLPAIAAINGRGGSSAAIGKDGSVWTWGYNANGQLGDGTTEKRFTPIAIGGFGNSPSIDKAGYQLSVNGKPVKLSVEPELNQGTVVMPLTQAVKAYGAKLTWDKNKQTATVTRGKNKVVLKRNSVQGTVNGKAVKLPIATLAKGDDWLLTADWLAKQLGGTAKLDSVKRTLVVVFPK
ncbi:stalk domain-containing protein [Cohnella mopanensis]|uniref:stalk domain-containing protein n=1 Tax=Cohnella mopanensis TaxID=2911966 RepID=UPI001EF7A668